MKKGYIALAAPLMVSLSAFLGTGAYAANEADCSDASAVAQVVSTCYTGVNDAIDAVGDGGTVTLLKDITETPTIDGKNMTLDLGGKTLTVGTWGVDIYDSTLTIQNGNVVRGSGNGALYINRGTTPSTVTLANGANIDGNGKTVIFLGDGVLNIQEGSTIKGLDAVNLSPVSSNANHSTVNMNGGTIEVTNAGITVNGTITDGPTINVSGGTISSAGSETVGLYLGGDNTTTISGGTITGTGAGVEIRAGDLTITGGNLTSTSTASEASSTPNGNGSTTTGAAVAIAQHTTKQPINVTISGGTFTGPAAFYESNPQSNDATAIGQVNASITGGTFNGKVSAVDLTDYMTGGSITVAPLAEEIDDGYDAFKKADGTYVVLPVPTTGTYNKTLEYGDSYTMEGLAPGFEEFYEENTTDTNVAYVVLPVITGVDLGDSTTTMTLHGVKSDYVNTYNISVVENPVEETTTVVATQEGSADAPNTGVATSSDSSVKSNNALMAAMAAGVNTMAGAFVVLKKRTRK